MKDMSTDRTEEINKALWTSHLVTLEISACERVEKRLQISLDTTFVFRFSSAVMQQFKEGRGGGTFKLVFQNNK